MPFDGYLKLEGVDSEATRQGFEKQIEVVSFDWGAHNPSTIGSGGGGGSGRVEVSRFNVTKKTDKASPLLFQACCSGRHFPKATLVLHKAGGNSAVDYLKLNFEEVFVEDVRWSGQTGGDDRPMESVSFAFGKVEMTYTPQKADGTKDSPVVASWDLRRVST